MKQPKKATFNFRPGWIIRDCSHATGGVSYDRELIKTKAINGEQGLQIDHKTRKTVDHVEFCTAIDAVVKKVDYVLRKHCVNTDMGWFADDKALAKVKAEVDVIAQEADALNAMGEQRIESQRRAKIHVVPLKLDLARPEAVQEIAQTVRDVLTEIRDTLRAGNIASMHKLKIRARNLERLATGFQSDAIQIALARAYGATKELMQTARDAKRAWAVGSGVATTAEESAKKKTKQAGPKLDLDAIEAAIIHFTDSPFAGASFGENLEALGDAL